MKKTVIFILVLTLVLSSFSFASASGLLEGIGKGLNEIISGTVNLVGKTLQELIQHTVGMFKDINSSDWFVGQVSKLVGSGGIDGYPDGTFKPTNTISRSEFTKVLVSVLGHKDMKATTGHWASGYIAKAEDIKLIDKGEFKDIDKTITRNEMAKMCANALDYLGESQVLDRAEYKGLIKDYTKIPTKYQDYVLKTYSKGIITGFPDGTFGGEKNLTRAEASAVVVRVIEKDERTIPEKPKQPTMPTEFGPNVDLKKVPIIGGGRATIRSKEDHNPNNLDFAYLLRTLEEIEPQYTDMENLLAVRFGSGDSTCKEIMNYIKSNNDLPLKWWTINGQSIAVRGIHPLRTISLNVWRAK